MVGEKKKGETARAVLVLLPLSAKVETVHSRGVYTVATFGSA